MKKKNKKQCHIDVFFNTIIIKRKAYDNSKPLALKQAFLGNCHKKLSKFIRIFMWIYVTVWSFEHVFLTSKDFSWRQSILRLTEKFLLQIMLKGGFSTFNLKSWWKLFEDSKLLQKYVKQSFTIYCRVFSFRTSKIMKHCIIK